MLIAARAVLDSDRVADVLDTDTVDRNVARIRAGLHILDGGRLRCTCRCGNAHRVYLCSVANPIVPAAANLGAVRTDFKPGTVTRQRSMAVAMPGISRPAAVKQSSRLPCSINRSGMPMCSRGVVRPAASSSSEQA